MRYLSLLDSLKLLEANGIRVTKYWTEISEDIEYPVVVKVSSENIIHKSDVGGVIVGIKDKESLENAVSSLKEKFPEADIIIQKQVEGKFLELIVSAKRDPTFGSFVMFGIGGIFTEIFKDFAILVRGFDERDLERAIDNLKSKKLFYGYRGFPPIGLNLLYDLLKRVEKMLENDNIIEIELNPVMFKEDEFHIVDARIQVRG